MTLRNLCLFLSAIALVAVTSLTIGCGRQTSEEKLRKTGPAVEDLNTKPIPSDQAADTSISGPPKPPIIINPGDDGNWIIGDLNAVADMTMTGNKLNECAFGTRSAFSATVETPENPTLQVSLVSATVTFGEKALDISVDGSSQFVWKINNQVLVASRPSEMKRWRPDLMVRPSSIEIHAFGDLQQPYTVKGIATKASGSCLGPQ